MMLSLTACVSWAPRVAGATVARRHGGTACFVRPLVISSSSSRSSSLRPAPLAVRQSSPQSHSASSSSSATSDADSANDDDVPSVLPAPKRARPRRTVTGGLKNLPVTPPANELLNRGLRLAKWLKIDEDKVKNQRMRARKLGALQLDTLTKAISKPLKDTLKAYEYELAVLHPFEATLADLTVRARAKQGHQSLPEVLGAVNEMRKSVLETGKYYAAAAKNASTKAEAIAAADEGFRMVEALVLGQSEVVLNLIEVQKALRKIPIVQLGTPTVVLVGAPNVGKSSIVRAISSGTPEVNNYPFTTRGMTLGHVEYSDWDEKCQVMDTPGVLNRPDVERNEMEALTLASMQHLPTAVMFVLDLTGNSGALSSIENQIQIRNDLRARFPKRPWVDVISKADLPVDPLDPAVAQAPEGALRVSTEDGTGIPELEARVREMLGDVREVLAVIGLREGGAEGGGGAGEGLR